MTIREQMARRPVYGTIVRSPAAEVVEAVAAGGFDFILVDHVYSAVDWQAAANMARAARAAGITAFYRPSTAAEAGESPASVAAQCTRALGVGFDGLFVSIASEADAAAMIMSVNHFWNRNLQSFTGSAVDLAEHKRRVREQLFVIAQFESVASLEVLEPVAAMDGIDGLAVANSDITAELTEGLDAEDDRVIRTVERVKRVCWENNLVLWCNTGYGFPSVEDMRDRGRALADRGANLILFQSAEFILTNSLKWLRRELS